MSLKAIIGEGGVLGQNPSISGSMPIYYSKQYARQTTIYGTARYQNILIHVVLDPCLLLWSRFHPPTYSVA